MSDPQDTPSAPLCPCVNCQFADRCPEAPVFEECPMFQEA